MVEVVTRDVTSSTFLVSGLSRVQCGFSFTAVAAQHKPNMEELLKKSGVKLNRPKNKHNDSKCTDPKYTGRDIELKPVLHEELLALFSDSDTFKLMCEHCRCKKNIEVVILRWVV